MVSYVLLALSLSLQIFFVNGKGPEGPQMVSVCGDPAMKLPPKILLEGWNFCNRNGRACDVAPRWADCVSPDGTQRVTPSDNSAGLPLPQQSQPTCDAFTEQKERNLGALCADTVADNKTSYFWTAMFKSGAMNVSERGKLCGLWCQNKTPSCNAALQLDPSTGDAVATASAPWDDNNYMMRQPRVVQEWTKSDGSGGWQGSFYGTLDQQANLSALPTPSELIAQALTPAPPPGPPGCTLDGVWQGQGDARLVISVQQSPGSPSFLASCTWAPGTPGLPAPWFNQSGSVDASNKVSFHVGGHVDTGSVVELKGGAAQVVCWSSSEWWCKGGACSGAAAQCAAHPSPSPSPTPAANVSSYFGMEWVTRGGRRIHRHVLRTGNDLGWLMLYTGPEAAVGLKGGYEWDGRGQYFTVPQSTTRNASSPWDPTWGKRPPNNFQVVQWTNITL